MGIDPGTVATGYGVIDAEDDELTLVDYGALKPAPRSTVGERLSFLYRELARLIELHSPEVVAVEQPFVGKNVKSAFAVGRAQAVAILAAVNRGIPAFEYAPAQVKQQVANYGASGKEQMQEVVRLQLGLSEVPQPADAADALAVAICHVFDIRAATLLGEEGG